MTFSTDSILGDGEDKAYDRSDFESHSDIIWIECAPGLSFTVTSLLQLRLIQPNPYVQKSSRPNTRQCQMSP